MRPVITCIFLAISSWSFTALSQIPVIGEVAIERLLNSDGTDFVLPAGFTFATDGTTAVVGVPIDSALGENSGTALVFARRSNGTWVQTHSLVPSNARACIRFGSTVAVAGDIIVVEESGREQTLNPNPPPGQSTCTGDPLSGNHSVRVFERSGSGWIETTVVPRGCCGSRLAIDGETVVVTRGTQGAEALQRLAPGVWSTRDFLAELGVVGALDAEVPAILPVDVSKNTVVLGSTVVAFETESYARGRGTTFALFDSANVYVRDTQGQWQLAADIVSDRIRVARPQVRFGAPVSLAGDSLALGSLMFRRNAFGDWVRVTDLTPVLGPSGFPDISLATEDIAFVRGTATDVFQRDADGIWRPAARLRSSALDAVGGVAVNGRLYSVVRPGAIHVFAAPVAPMRAPRMSQMRVTPDRAIVGDSVQVVVFADATESDFTTIRELEVSVAGGPWSHMTPIDGAYDEPFEAGIAAVAAGIAGTTTPGTYPVCFRVTDAAGRQAELPNTQESSCQSIEILPPPSGADDLAPEVSELRVYASQVTVGQDNGVVAFADDTGRGESGIRSLQWRLESGPWQVMLPVDALFDGELFEAATGNLPGLGAPGRYFVCVRAVDLAGNVSSDSCTHVDVVPP